MRRGKGFRWSPWYAIGVFSCNIFIFVIIYLALIYVNVLYRVKVESIIENGNGFHLFQNREKLPDNWQILGDIILLDRSNLHVASKPTSKTLLTLCSTFLVDQMTDNLLQFFKTYAFYQQYFSLRMIVFSESDVILRLGKRFNITIVPNVPVNEYNKPIFPKMMQILERTVDSSFYGYVNGDILLSHAVFSFLHSLHSNHHTSFLVHTGVLLAGRVKEVANAHFVYNSLPSFIQSFNSSYHRGSLRNPLSADYFIYSGRLMSKSSSDYEDVVLGRFYIDNWIMGSIHLHHGYLVDTTVAIEGIHLGTDTYWKKSIKQMQNPSDFFYNKYVVRRNYPWSNLKEANYTARWEGQYLFLEKHF